MISGSSVVAHHEQDGKYVSGLDRGEFSRWSDETSDWIRKCQSESFQPNRGKEKIWLLSFPASRNIQTFPPGAPALKQLRWWVHVSQGCAVPTTDRGEERVRVTGQTPGYTHKHQRNVSTAFAVTMQHKNESGGNGGEVRNGVADQSSQNIAVDKQPTRADSRSSTIKFLKSRVTRLGHYADDK